MDCFYHHAVPSVARCTSCDHRLCASCRGEGADCASCRLASRVDAASATRQRLAGGIGPSYSAPPPPRPEPPVPTAPRQAVAVVSGESRGFSALGYPFWPLALLALLDPTKSPYVRRHALQALGFNAGIYALGWMLAGIATIPLVGISAWFMLPLIVPFAIVASVIYCVKTWHGEEVRVPIITEWIEGKTNSPV